MPEEYIRSIIDRNPVNQKNRGEKLILDGQDFVEIESRRRKMYRMKLQLILDTIVEGTGDMAKAVYDPNDDGKIAYAQTSGVQETLVSATNIKTVNGDTILGSGDLTVTSAETYETVSKNLIGYPYVITYDGDDIDYITYDLGGGDSIVKTFNYTLGVLTSLVLSGDTPSGIDLTKTLNYTGDDLTSVKYS